MEMQKFIFPENATRDHHEAHLGVGSCTLFVPPYTLYPQTGVFLKVWCPPSPSKKRHPGIRGLSPGIAFCREMPVKSYWDGEDTGVLIKNRESSWISTKI